MFKTLTHTYKAVFNLLPKELIRKFWAMQFLIVLTSIIDVFGFASFIPVLSAVANPELIDSSVFFLKLKMLLGIVDNKQFLLFLFVSAFLFFLFRSLFILFSQNLQSKFVFKLSEYIGVKTYSYYLNLDFEEFQKIDSAKIIRELTISPHHFARFLVMPLLLISAEAVMLATIILGIALYDIKVFFLLVLTVFPAAIIFQSIIKRRVKFYGEEQNRLTPEFYSNSNRGIFGFIDVKLRSKETVLVNDYFSVLKKLNKINVVTTLLNVIPSKLFEIITVAGLLVIYIYAAFLAENPAMVIPIIAIYAAAGYRILPSLSKIVPAFMQLDQYSYLLKVYKMPLSDKVHIRTEINREDKVILENKIELRNIVFKFKRDENLFFSGLNLMIKKGEIIGLIGKSGTGKTTLVKMITGFYIPTGGELLVDNVKITEQNIKSWMSQISYVQQSPYIEKGNLSSNIVFLESEVNNERLNEVIAMSSLSEFVGNRNPADIFIDEDGKNLSGGQKQRICIARALYNNSKLLVFDEATSALDNDTEREVNLTIEKLKGTGVTIIIIAHRYSTLVHSDRVLELSGDGKYNITNYQSIITNHL